MQGYRRFCNKIYQATKYVLGKLGTNFVPERTLAKTGKESLAERWILHKFTIAAKEMNEALTNREFSEAASISYQYWLAQLCDVYIENSKSLIQEGTPEEKLSAKQTLYTVLDGGLTMIHPFMPFLTEELWQRLPRRPGDTCPSIVKAKYPIFSFGLVDPVSEQAYDLILGVAKAIRSLMGEYAIRDAGTLYISLTDPTARETCKNELLSIHSLAGKGVASINILSPYDPKPTGCVPSAVSSIATVFLLVKGRVDIDAEIVKAKAKMDRAGDLVARQKKILDDEGYRAKVSEELQEVERRKLRDAEAELREMEASVQQFEALKLD